MKLPEFTIEAVRNYLEGAPFRMEVLKIIQEEGTITAYCRQGPEPYDYILEQIFQLDEKEQELQLVEIILPKNWSVSD